MWRRARSLGTTAPRDEDLRADEDPATAYHRKMRVRNGGNYKGNYNCSLYGLH